MITSETGCADAATSPVRVLMLSKALVVGSYQRKPELLATVEGIDLTVVVPPLWRDGDLVRRLERAHTQGYRLVETPIVRPGDFHLHFYPMLAQSLRTARPQLVHVDEEPYNLATFLALRAARRIGARTLFFTWQNLRRRYPPPFGWFERYAHRHADGAIVGSHTAGIVLRAKGYAGAMWHLPQFGIDPALYRPREAPLPPRPLEVGYAGRLVHAKGVDLLLQALAEMRSPWHLHVLGEGDARPALEALARTSGVSDRVSWSPWRGSAAMPDYYRSLDVLVLPSRSTPSWIEQFGRVLIEAMACGVPCVGSASGEIPHVLGDAGIVFAEGDADALRAALSMLAARPEARARLGAAGRARVLARYTMAHVASETARIYRSILAGGSPASDGGDRSLASSPTPRHQPPAPSGR